jgi:hypothetical protein
MNRAARIALACAVLSVAALPSPVARADALRLENGKVMHGTVERGFVDPDCLKIQLFSTGGLVRVRWEHLIAEDREEWQVALGLKESAESQELKIPAHRIRFVATTDTMLGLVLNPEALDPSGPPTAEVRIQKGGTVVVYPRAAIAKAEDVSLDLALVYTPLQAYEKKRDELQPNNGEGHHQLGDYARLVGAYDQAKEEYLKARADADHYATPRGKQLDSKLATIEILIRNKSLQQDLDAVKLKLIQARAAGDFVGGAKMYLEARDAMFRLMTQLPDKKIQAEFRIPELATRVEAERRGFFEKKLFMEIRKRLQMLAYEKAREGRVKDIPIGTSPQDKAALLMKGTFEGARQYFTRQVTDDLLAGIMKDVGSAKDLEELNAIMEKDPAKLTQEQKDRAIRLAQAEKSLKTELGEYWKGRAKAATEVTTYGYGTFVVVKSDLKLTRKQPQQGQGGNRNNPAPAGPQQQAVDVVKTPDQWWDGAGANERKNWLLSWYAERGGFLDVVRAWEDPCKTCAGKGFLAKSVATTGEEEAERCPVCNGAKVERKVRWR